MKQKGTASIALVLMSFYAISAFFFFKQGLLLIAIAVAVLLPKCQTNSCENASLESKIIHSSDFCSLSIFIPVLSPIDCSFCFLQCFVQFFLNLGFMV